MAWAVRNCVLDAREHASCTMFSRPIPTGQAPPLPCYLWGLTIPMRQHPYDALSAALAAGRAPTFTEEQMRLKALAVTAPLVVLALAVATTAVAQPTPVDPWAGLYVGIG